jgi:hypothetical protein
MGDANLMSVLADVKVMPEYIQTTLRQFRQRLEGESH